MTAHGEAEPLLTVDDLYVNYGSIAALRGVTLRVDRGEVVAVVGPNGAGKSTLLGAVAGLVRPRRGEIHFGGKPLAGLSIEDILRVGIALVPEGRHIFATMTVAENLQLGATIRSDRPAIAQDIEALTGRFPILRARWRQPAGRLSGGEQQQLAIARAMLCRPTLLMLDEPSLGLAPALIDQVYLILRELHAQGTAILLVEQNAARALDFADRTYILSAGALGLSGTRRELLDHPDFEAAYFGVGEPPPASPP